MKATKLDPLADVDRHRSLWKQGEIDGAVVPAPDKRHRVAVRGFEYTGEKDYVNADDRPIRYLNAPLYITDDFAKDLLTQLSPTGVDALWTRLSDGQPVRGMANEYRLVTK